MHSLPQAAAPFDETCIKLIRLQRAVSLTVFSSPLCPHIVITTSFFALDSFRHTNANLVRRTLASTQHPGQDTLHIALQNWQLAFGSTDPHHRRCSSTPTQISYNSREDTRREECRRPERRRAEHNKRPDIIPTWVLVALLGCFAGVI